MVFICSFEYPISQSRPRGPMKSIHYSRYDWLLQLIVLPIYIGLLNWIMIGNAYWSNSTTLVLASLFAFIESFLNWLLNNQIALYINRKYGKMPFIRRSLYRFASTSASSVVNASLLYALYWGVNLPGFEFGFTRLGFALLYTTVIVAIVVVTYEGMDSFNYWQQSRQEVETLSKAQLQTQLDALRQQVNPHFLFNSLNSLISLIDENPLQASAFAEELSTVYRYLLRSNESPLVPLASELDFIESYYHLLKTRHGDSLTLAITVQSGAETRQLPPLTLQLLIENAVKHNIILPEQPLTITLTATAQCLVVSNNLQRKPGRTLSNGVGLSNILTKYQMLDQPAPTIEDDGQSFRVTLPLV
jgi:sensor histidine kinase YesM